MEICNFMLCTYATECKVMQITVNECHKSSPFSAPPSVQHCETWSCVIIFVFLVHIRLISFTLQFKIIYCRASSQLYMVTEPIIARKCTMVCNIINIISSYIFRPLVGPSSRKCITKDGYIDIYK